MTDNTIEEAREMRDVRDIAKKILIEIPVEENEFIESINNFIKSLHYSAPELLRGSECWIPFTNILNYYIDDTNVEWQKKIIDIYTGNI